VIQYLDMAARFARVAHAIEPALSETLYSGRYIGGSQVDAFTRAIADLFGKAHGVGVGCGTDAVTMAVQSLGIGPGDEVIVPAVSFFATAGGVLRAGAIPVVVDVLPDRPLLDPDAAAAARSPRTRAVMPVHLFGDCAPHPEIGIDVIDDAAQAVGASHAVGRGIAAAVSFYPTKILGALGEAGMVVTDDPEIAKHVRLLGSHGMHAPHDHHLTAGHMGGNSRLDAIQATMLLAQLPDLPIRIARRQSIAKQYDDALSGLPIPRDPGSPVSVYVIRHPKRDALRKALHDHGVQTAIYYPTPMSQQPALAQFTHRPTPHADVFCQQAMALPCHEALSDEDVQGVIDAVRACA